MRVIVTGSRTWTDYTAIFRALNEVDRTSIEELVIVHGACPDSPDMVADDWADVSEPHPADWDRHGKAAGPIRNQEMVDLGADLCLAFIARCDKFNCGKYSRFAVHGSHGATDCAQRAAAAGIPTIVHMRWGQT